MTRRKKGARDLTAYNAPPSTARCATPQAGLQAHSLHRPLMRMPAERSMVGLGGKSPFSDALPWERTCLCLLFMRQGLMEPRLAPNLIYSRVRPSPQELRSQVCIIMSGLRAKILHDYLKTGPLFPRFIFASVCSLTIITGFNNLLSY